MAIFWNLSISNYINWFDVSNKLLTSVLVIPSWTHAVVLTSWSLTLCFFLIAYVPFVGVAEYSRSCSLCLITTDNWLTSRLAINFRRWSTADDTFLALLVPGEAVNPNTCKKIQIELFKKGCNILLYHIFCCDMFVFACPIIAKSQCWVFATGQIRGIYL